MRKLIKITFIVLIASIIMLGVIFGPSFIEAERIHYEESNFQCEYSSPTQEMLEVFVGKSESSLFGREVTPTYYQIYWNALYVYTRASDAEYFVYVKEKVPNNGTFITEVSPTYSFNYQSLMENGGYANITLVSSYLLIEILPWDV